MNTKERKGGVALIMSVGILALLAMIATSFAINMQLEYKAAVNQLNYTKAAALAEAGIEKAIAELIQNAKTNFTFNADSVNSGTYSDITLNYGLGSYEVKIEDEQRKVNINYANRELLKALLGDSDYTRADAIINYRGASLTNPFKTIDEIKLVSGIDDAVYKNIEEDITVNSYLDPNTIDDSGEDEPRCPININTSDEKILNAVLSPLGATDSSITAIINGKDDKPGRPFSTWQQFNDIVDTFDVSAAIKNNIKNNCNPNRTKPSGYTTDLCFFSGGNYALTSTGKIFSSTNQTEATKLAEKKIKVIVKIYGILNQTKKSQFQGNSAYALPGGDKLPKAFQANTYDSCPVESILSRNNWNAGGGSVDYPASGDYKTVPDSIKNGFWDNMSDSGPNDMFYLMNNTQGVTTGTWYQAKASNRMNYLWWPYTDNNTIANGKLFIYGDNYAWLWGHWDQAQGKWVETPTSYSPITLLGNKNNVSQDLIWSDFAWRSTFSDGTSPYNKDALHKNQAGFTPPGISFYNYDVVVHMSRYHDTARPNQDESRQRQNYASAPAGDNDLGDFETHVATEDGWHWLANLPGSYYSPAPTTENVFVTIASGSDHEFYAYKGNNGKPDLQRYAFSSKSSTFSSGQVGWQVWGAMPYLLDPSGAAWVTNVRIVPGSGAYFTSTPLACPIGNVTWGVIGATQTLSSGADPSLSATPDKVYFQTSVDNGNTWSPDSLPGVLAGSSIVSAASSTILYRANFTTLDNAASEVGVQPYLETTIALEDITITYLLPSAEVIYYEKIP